MAATSSDSLPALLEQHVLDPSRVAHPAWSLGVTRLVEGKHVPLARVGDSDPFVEDAGDQIQLSAPVRFEGVTMGRVYALVGDAVTPEDQGVLQQLAQEIAPLLAAPSEGLASLCLSTCEELRANHPRFDWVGVYRLDTREDLVLACQRGLPTPHVRISVSSGICGAAVREGATLNIPDVTADERFIACSPRTRSELVVPVRLSDGRIVAEIDVDSDTPAAFGPSEVMAIEDAARRLGLAWEQAGSPT